MKKRVYLLLSLGCIILSILFTFKQVIPYQWQTSFYGSVYTDDQPLGDYRLRVHAIEKLDTVIKTKNSTLFYIVTHEYGTILLEAEKDDKDVNMIYSQKDALATLQPTLCVRVMPKYTSGYTEIENNLPKYLSSDNMTLSRYVSVYQYKKVAPWAWIISLIFLFFALKYLYRLLTRRRT
ncbi:hypothetical protein GMA11_06300 [Granulicatella sp. zg-ZJ]|uniref:hypothetical protein n=1 Tax=unclassified Granulicatella TaxID=2630493 RepID=UPI0013BF33E2|nr:MULTISPECIES: hypothetical protein [unclassified Granulicatella]MBS4749561.1 hypothetical protein [Carnobacteriaceae bacterium zg-ZUI78]QMI86495.1 hypothetical protein H1220_03890 [Carnobacteriaceae bacterium zg-84]NEW62457.1 hypothetical protein [Granulicatella sp. zg-ZJ]NEW63003.1 hypothetical protein [Granulicatella sp. zg-ZJ]NEW65753.1 hypothetical protein [Granulicatella sp. zg-84]